MEQEKQLLPTNFFLLKQDVLIIINADLIAQGLSPFQPEKMAISAGRFMITNIDECVRKHESFAFETTISGKGYIHKIMNWKNKGYEVIIYFLKLPSVEYAIERVKLRVVRGGHDVPEQDIRRRFERSWINFNLFYKHLADSWIIFDTSDNQPVFLDESE